MNAEKRLDEMIDSANDGELLSLAREAIALLRELWLLLPDHEEGCRIYWFNPTEKAKGCNCDEGLLGNRVRKFLDGEP